MIPYYKNRVCLNVLAGSLENAKEIYESAEGHVVVGVLSKDYDTVEAACEDMGKYMDILEGNLSIGLGAGDAKQCYAVCQIAETIKAHHINQVFTYVGNTRQAVNNDASHVNALVSPTGKPGYLKISTGPVSGVGDAAIVSVEAAINMVKDMGGNSLKFFPMKGLEVEDELIEVAKACAKHDFILEPTGGIDLENYETILRIILNAGVKQVIPHIYSSIIDDNGNTRTKDVATLLQVTKDVLNDFM